MTTKTKAMSKKCDLGDVSLDWADGSGHFPWVGKAWKASSRGKTIQRRLTVTSATVDLVETYW